MRTADKKYSNTGLPSVTLFSTDHTGTSKALNPSLCFMYQQNMDHIRPIGPCLVLDPYTTETTGSGRRDVKEIITAPILSACFVRPLATLLYLHATAQGCNTT
jgi:hypothetical protein